MRTLWLCGAGNPEGVRLALRVNGREQRWERIALLDDDAKKHGLSILGLQVAGSLGLLDEADPETSDVVNLVARTTATRRRVRERLEGFGMPFASLIDPDVDSLGVELGEGVTAYRGATLSALARVGAGSVLFAGSNAGHGSRLGEDCVLAPGAIVNARVELGELCYVGCNATILPDLRVGAAATIGAGSAVLEDVPAGATVMGVPARVVLNAGDGAAAEPLLEPPDGAAPPDARLEALVATAWAAALGVPQVGRTENFFDLGGTSLLALRVRADLERATRQEIQLTDLYRFPTVWALAAHLARGDASSPVLRAAEQRGRLRWRRQVAG